MTPYHTEISEMIKNCSNEIRWSDGIKSGYSSCGEDGVLCDTCISKLQTALTFCEDDLKRCEKLIVDNISEQEYLNYIIGFMVSLEGTMSILELSKERLENIIKEYNELKSLCSEIIKRINEIKGAIQ